MRTPPPFPVLARTTAAVVLAATVVVASAASLGGIAAGTVGAWTLPAVIEPGPIACGGWETQPDGTKLDGLPAGCGGGTWTTSGGNWHVVNGQLKANAKSALATVAGGSPFLSAEVTVIGTDVKKRSGGLVMSHDATTGFHLAAVLVGPNQVELRAVGATTVVLGSASVTIRPESRLRFTRTTSTATVTVDGVTKISVSIATGSFPGTGVGLYHAGGPAVGFSGFVVTPPGLP